MGDVMEDIQMEDVREVVKAFLELVELERPQQLNYKKLYKIIMFAYAQGLGAELNKRAI
jgi:hypothetical protein